MKVTWLGEAGLLFENEDIKIMVDPSFSDSGERKRRIEPDMSFLSASPDVILITHEHSGHLDMDTLKKISENKGSEITFLAPQNAYKKLVTLAGCHNYVMLNSHSVWSESGVTFYSVHAEHSDRTAVGFIIDDGRKTYYVSGDTLYNYDVIDDVLELVEDGVDVAFLPINGKDNNMNAKDAADFAYEIGAKRAVPVHYGMYDTQDPKSFDFEDAMILQPFEKTDI